MAIVEGWAGSRKRYAMSIARRIAKLCQANANALLGRAEDPREMPDHSTGSKRLARTWR